MRAIRTPRSEDDLLATTSSESIADGCRTDRRHASRVAMRRDETSWRRGLVPNLPIVLLWIVVHICCGPRPLHHSNPRDFVLEGFISFAPAREPTRGKGARGTEQAEHRLAAQPHLDGVFFSLRTMRLCHVYSG